MGGTRMYEHIVKGNHSLEPGLPESFNVLVKELQSLALDVRTERLRGEEPVVKAAAPAAERPLKLSGADALREAARELAKKL